MAVRRPFFNASSASILFDRHPFQTPGDYAAIKLTGEEQADNRAMLRGRTLEEPIAQWWASDLGYTLYEPTELFVAGRMMATVDRFTTQHERPVEIKTTARQCDEPEDYWLDQCQAIMWCCDADTLDLVWFDSSLDIQWQVVDADPQLQLEMSERAERFMASIDLGIVPDWITLSARNVATIHPDPQGAVEVNEDAVGLVQQYVELRALRKQVDADMEKARDAVVNVIGPAEVATYDGQPIATYKATRGHWSVDTKALQEKEPAVFERFKVWKSGHRTFSPKLS